VPGVHETMQASGVRVSDSLRSATVPRRRLILGVRRQINMTSVLTYCFLIVLAFAWIYRDSGTEDVFIVYGSQFRTACQMKAWSAFVVCGWRLLLLLTLAGACLWLAIRVMAQNSFGLSPFLLYAVVGAMVIAVGFLFPWISLSRRKRFNQLLASAAEKLTPIAVKFTEEPDPSREYQPAGYQTDGSWMAWHPKDELWQRPEMQATWFRIVPVVYATTSVPRTLAIPATWDSFLIWGDPTSWARSGELLPFTGPGGTRVMAGRIRRWAYQGKWSLLHTTMLSNEPDGAREWPITAESNG
jgi:hypothetical protein